MADNKLTLSDDGIAKLKEYEDVIDGLYDDSSEYCTFGIGHLVHPKDKWNKFSKASGSLRLLFQKF
jgi:hypothetical protein